MPGPALSFTITSVIPPGAFETDPTAINVWGEVGSDDESSGSHDFIYDNDMFITLERPRR
jgi:hypothetical protein